MDWSGECVDSRSCVNCLESLQLGSASMKTREGKSELALNSELSHEIKDTIGMAMVECSSTVAQWQVKNEGNVLGVFW